jgi:hypothetical protein
VGGKKWSVKPMRAMLGREGVRGATNGDDGDSSLGGPSEENLSVGLVVSLADGADDLGLEERVNTSGHAELVERLRTERRVGGDGNAEGLAELDEGLLGEVGVVLDLENGRGDGGVSEDVDEEGTGDVGDTDVLGEAGLHLLLHGHPGFLVRGVLEVDCKGGGKVEFISEGRCVSGETR